MSIEQIYDELTDLKRSATFYASKVKKLEMEIRHLRGHFPTKEIQLAANKKALAVKMKQILGFLKDHQNELDEHIQL